MITVSRFAAFALILGFSVAGATSALAAKGQDFPDTKCTCKGCGPKKTDVTGQCASVCKDKTVYSKGSEPHDYCKAARVKLPKDWNRAEPATSKKAN